MVIEGASQEECGSSQEVVDVTIALQCLVKDSKLILQESSKVRIVMPCRNSQELSSFTFQIQI